MSSSYWKGMLVVYVVLAALQGEFNRFLYGKSNRSRIKTCEFLDRVFVATILVQMHVRDWCWEFRFIPFPNAFLTTKEMKFTIHTKKTQRYASTYTQSLNKVSYVILFLSCLNRFKNGCIVVTIRKRCYLHQNAADFSTHLSQQRARGKHNNFLFLLNLQLHTFTILHLKLFFKRYFHQTNDKITQNYRIST